MDILDPVEPVARVDGEEVREAGNEANAQDRHNVPILGGIVQLELLCQEGNPQRILSRNEKVPLPPTLLLQGRSAPAGHRPGNPTGESVHRNADSEASCVFSGPDGMIFTGLLTGLTQRS